MIRLRSAISAMALSMVLAGIVTAPARAQLFGPSDEEKAHEAAQDSQLADLARTADQLGGRVQALESKVQSLTSSLANATGASEELSHRIQIQNQKIDSMQKDFAYRICTLSAQQLGVAGDGSDGGLNCAAAGPCISGSSAAISLINAMRVRLAPSSSCMSRAMRARSFSSACPARVAGCERVPDGAR